MIEALVAYLHYTSVIVMGAALFTEYSRCHEDMQPPDIRVLARVDVVYFIAAIAVSATGLARVFLLGKGVAYYFHNPVLYIKLALFLAVGLLSIPPTLQFIRWNRALKSGQGRILNGDQISATRHYLIAELIVFLFIPLAAVMMARGFGIQATPP
ncbi:MAG: DUF2214 family protein [Betaproteobacteria bacterium]|nr:DUF2214 family protein [Betaproteobacteria bacterium]